MTERAQVYVCDCQGEAVVLEPQSAWGEVHMAFWRYGHGEFRSWRQRLRWIWWIIRRGHPYTDMVCLSLEEAERLGHGLIKAAKEARK